MTDPHDEHGDILRRALRAEAETVAPSADGLEQILARIGERPPSRFGWTWFTPRWTRPMMAVAIVLFFVAIAVASPAIERFGSPVGNGTGGMGRYGQGGATGSLQPGQDGQTGRRQSGQQRPGRGVASATPRVSAPGQNNCPQYSGGVSAAPTETARPGDPQVCPTHGTTTPAPTATTAPPDTSPSPVSPPPTEPQPEASTGAQDQVAP